MKIVITGALGHIGSYLIRNLAVQFPGAEIIIIDNMMTQRFPSLFNLPSVGVYRFIEGDVLTMALNPILDDANVVVHLAAITDAAGSFGRAEEVERNNYHATLKVVESCVKTDTALIALSSTSVYGTQNEIVAEDCSPDELQPQSPYAKTKINEESLVNQYSNEQGLKAVSFRFGTIFGVSPGMRFHTAVNKFCWQAVMGKPLTVWSTAYEQKRPYLDLSDAVGAISFIIRQKLYNGEIYNVLTNNATVKNIVEIIKEFVPKLQIEFVENQIMNQLSYEVSCEKFKSEGFVFLGDLRKGIGDTITLLNQANYKQ